MAVTNLEIKSRQPFAQGQSFGNTGTYEQLDGTAHFAVDPDHPNNSTITDLKLARRGSDGLVHFSSDIRILRPVEPQKGNHRVFFDILNRGRGPALRNFNNAPDLPPSQPLDPGNGFLMRQGYTVVWCGWQHDAPDVPGVLRLHGPGAEVDGHPVSGKIVVTFQPNSPINVQFLSDRNHRPYRTNHLEDWDAVMTVQDHEDAPEEVVPREQWAFARLEDGRVVPDAAHVYMAAGFTPGKVYQVIYSTTGAPVVGLGLAATRDLGSFLRYGAAQDGNPCAGDIEHAYTFGSSQSGRFLRDLLYYDLDHDEQDRIVFDGLIPHVAGGKHGEFNQRFAQPSSQASRSPNNLFPFSDTEQTDPETGITDGVLSRISRRSSLPRVMYTYSSSEYWGGGGALVHVDIGGTRDLGIPENVRVYFFGGAQHPVGSLDLKSINPENGIHGQQPFNCIDYRPLLRAALVNLDRWVTSGQTPPPSGYPRIDNRTAVPPESLAATFKAIPGVNFPNPLRRFSRLDFGFQQGVPTIVPPKIGKPYPLLVSAVDSDGNEVCGIRMPIVTVPLATHTGWNLRHADIGGEGQILSSGGGTGGTLNGSTIPFPVTKEQREVSGDPRLSIEERYASKEDYLERVKQATQAMIDQGYILEEDLKTITDQATLHYQELAARVKEPQTADN